MLLPHAGDIRIQRKNIIFLLMTRNGAWKTTQFQINLWRHQTVSHFLCHDDGGKKTQLQQQITIRYYGHKMGYTLLCLNYKSFMANLTFLRVVVNYTAQKADFLFLKYRESK